jgi:glycosyltransferase involved in cell wall biosynthesis
VQSNAVKVKILFDPEIYYKQEYGGISRYYSEVVSILKRNKNLEVNLPVCHTENAYAHEYDLIQETKIMQLVLKVLAAMNVSTRTLQKKIARRLFKKTAADFKFDLYIPTYFDTSFLSFIGTRPFVLTVYDMIHELFPQYYEDEPSTIVQDKLALMEKATKIIAVSFNTKKDILKLYPHIDESKIEVIYHGNSIKFDDRIKVELPSRYILFVGIRSNYKNFQFLLKSIVELLKKDNTLFLLCAGGDAFTEEEVAFFAHLGVEKQIIQKKFKEQELANFYKNAKCFVFPSRYEGFGIPVLESMACGCPIVLAKHSSFPEVAGDAGVYFELDSFDDLRNKINLLLTNDEVRKEFSDKGLARAKKFNWYDATEQCLNVYFQALEIARTK